jgi:hypothetical protein
LRPPTGSAPLALTDRGRVKLLERIDTGRYLGSCKVEEHDVSRWLDRSGWALAFRRYSTAYIADEEYAREQKQGLWAGAFIAPRDWRHRSTQTTILGAFSVPEDAQQKLIFPGSSSRPPEPDCVIKANLKSRNQCIYHVPGGQFYDRLNMQLTESRRWFCGEAEARPPAAENRSSSAGD